MSFENQRAVIEDRFQTLFADLNPTVAVAYEGRSFQRPAGDITWIAVQIIGGDSNRMSLGPNATFRRRGIAQFVISTEAQKGSRPSRLIADELNTIFTDVDVDLGGGEVLRFEEGKLKPIGIRDGKYVAMFYLSFNQDTIGT